jgi:Holliday junction resolvase RusA-like endonuclease
MMELILPWPPTVNHYKKIGGTRITKKGKSYQARVNTSETKVFYYEVWLKLRHLKLESFKNARLSVEIRLYADSHRKMDIDNRVKVLLDALQKGNLYDDDSQIDRLLITRCNPEPPIGKVIVIVSKI